MGPDWYALDDGVRISVARARPDGGTVVVDVALFNDRAVPFRVSGMTLDTPRAAGGSLTCPLAVKDAQGRPVLAPEVAPRTAMDLAYRCPVPPASTLRVTAQVYGEDGVTFVGSVGADAGANGATRPGQSVSGPTSITSP